ncbi:techylectin-5A-like [Argiope bruennichi]|uniref:techylectin-5A-like n=1 Tax=Argiope bruennichi TaxID=94029 RepID=UPI00249554A5|nr:techylectin-5A-like [Argiope bruennichi]
MLNMPTSLLCRMCLLILLIQHSKGQDDDDFEPRDCSDHLMNGNYESRIYTIFPNSKSLNVYCDMDTDGGGWTVIQRRGNYTPQEKFYRDWNDYKHGFGNVDRDFWLGNDNIHTLSTLMPVEIRFDLADVRGNRRYAVYKSFYIDNEKKDYTLHISGYSGNAGDGMKFHNGQPFSTKDRGNYQAVLAIYGPWWIFEWAYVHLNGFYSPGENDFQAIHWYKWLENEGLAFSEMKIRQR